MSASEYPVTVNGGGIGRLNYEATGRPVCGDPEHRHGGSCTLYRSAVETEAARLAEMGPVLEPSAFVDQASFAPTVIDARRAVPLPPTQEDLRIREWVVGFLVDPETDDVLLIRKKRPSWMAGLLNGIGGKVEDEDVRRSVTGPGWVSAAHHAMVREFEEEAGVRVTDWRLLVSMTAVSVEDRSGQITSEPGTVHFFVSHHPVETWAEVVKAQTDEALEIHDIGDLISVQHPLRATWWLQNRAMVPNLRWLLPLASHTADEYEPVQVKEISTTLRRNVQEDPGKGRQIGTFDSVGHLTLDTAWTHEPVSGYLTRDKIEADLVRLGIPRGTDDPTLLALGAMPLETVDRRLGCRCPEGTPPGTHASVSCPQWGHAG